MNEYVDTQVQVENPQTILYTDHQRMVNGLTERIDSLRAQLGDQIHRATAFKGDVRNALVAFKDDEDIDTETMNGLLDELGLDPIETDYTVSWTETYTVTIERSGTISAENEEDASDKVSDDPDNAESDDSVEDLIDTAVRFGNFERTDVTVDNVDEA